MCDEIDHLHAANDLSLLSVRVCLVMVDIVPGARVASVVALKTPVFIYSDREFFRRCWRHLA
jgi:hypothetical protein